jgi:hypothetical protein
MLLREPETMQRMATPLPLRAAAKQKAPSFSAWTARNEIDLSTGHAKELRSALARYIEAGRRVTGTTGATHNGRKTPALGATKH